MDTFENSPALEVRSCSKEYRTFGWKFRGRSKPFAVFENLNMTVPRGTTYALLGPSGCGKTTLLKCIMGRLDVDSGLIRIFGQSLRSRFQMKGSDIGYMPQETALFTLLTIEETLQYYGRILGLPNVFIKSQIKFFVEFLRLPSKNTRNQKLSGGQLRRLSFAVAAIQQPKLLIMDEPTVGVDPIIRQRMWCYLEYMMQKCSTSIILTTHYIEEARSANVVGLMHNRRMMLEGSPDNLLAIWKVATLEELFFKVCTKHLESDSKLTDNRTKRFACAEIDQSHLEYQCSDIGTNRNIRKNSNVDMDNATPFIKQTLNRLSLREESLTKDTGFLNISRVLAIVKKNFIMLYRFPFALLFLLFLPAAQMAVSYAAMENGLANLDVGVFNNDTGHFGEVYLDSLDTNVIKQIQYNSYQSGFQDVLNGKRFGFIYIQNNFSDAIIERFHEETMLKQRLTQSGLISVTIDKTVRAISQVLAYHTLQGLKALNERALHDIGYHPNSSSIMQITFQPEEMVKGSVILFMIPSFIIMFMHVIQIGMSLLFMFLEKTNGYLERSLVLGVTFFEIVLSYAIIQFFVTILQAAALLIVVFGLFNSLLIGSYGLTAVMAITSGLVGMAVGMFVSAWLDQLLVIATIGLTVVFSLPGFVGTFWPVQSSPIFFQYLCACLPFYIPKEALARIMYRGSGLFDPDVALSLVIMLSWIFVLISLSILCLRRYVK